MGSHGIVHGQGHPKENSLSSSYETAMEALSTLITRRRRGDGSNRSEKFDLMLKYLTILGLKQHVAGLKIIHIAGTKGKGSTCAFSESILRECGFQTGLFTSPHLIDVRERYRINGLDISEDKFLQYFWECWNQLKEKISGDLPMPPLFQFLTLLAFKIFLSEKVDVAILEVGLGGRLDSTNVIKKPVVCGITSLGMDHTEILGDTLGKIASEKAGIFKPQVSAFTVPQLPEAMDALQERAAELRTPLEVALPLDLKKLDGCKLGLDGDHQLINAGLSVALCRSWLQNTGHWNLFSNEPLEAGLPEPFRRGLSTAWLPGRAQIIHDNFGEFHKMPEVNGISSGDLIFYLDGAHSPESMEVCARWFCNAVKEDIHSSEDDQKKELHGHYGHPENKNYNASSKILKQILLFNCMETRDPQLLLPKLINTCDSSGVHFSKALFVPGMSLYHKVDSGVSLLMPEISKDVSWQFSLQRTWEKILHGKDAVTSDDYNLEKPEKLPSYGFLYEEHSQKCNPGGKQFTCGAVIPSLPLTLKWLRDCVKDNPTIRLQVLVTGSLHLVGDLLKLMKR